MMKMPELLSTGVQRSTPLTLHLPTIVFDTDPAFLLSLIGTTCNLRLHLVLLELPLLSSWIRSSVTSIFSPNTVGFSVLTPGTHLTVQ